MSVRVGCALTVEWLNIKETLLTKRPILSWQDIFLDCSGCLCAWGKVTVLQCEGDPMKRLIKETGHTLPVWNCISNPFSFFRLHEDVYRHTIVVLALLKFFLFGFCLHPIGRFPVVSLYKRRIRFLTKHRSPLDVSTIIYLAFPAGLNSCIHPGGSIQEERYTEHTETEQIRQNHALEK